MKPYTIRKLLNGVKAVLFRDKIIGSTNLPDKSTNDFVDSLNDAYAQGRKSVSMAQWGTADKNGKQLTVSDWELA
jgi:hypothetical protein